MNFELVYVGHFDIHWVHSFFKLIHHKLFVILFYFAKKAAVPEKVAWAFGMGLDRLTMIQYQIPDIRLLWTEDRRFLDQFNVDNPETKIIYKVACETNL